MIGVNYPLILGTFSSRKLESGAELLFFHAVCLFVCLVGFVCFLTWYVNCPWKKKDLCKPGS